MEIRDLGSQARQSHDRFQRTVTLNLSGLAVLLVFFVVLIAFEGKFSVLLTSLTLVMVSGAILSGLGWRSGKSWVTLAGALALIGLVLAGLLASR